MNEIDNEQQMYSRDVLQNKMDGTYKQGKFDQNKYNNPWGHGQYFQGGYYPYWKGGYMPYWQGQYNIPPWALLLALGAFGPRYPEENMYNPYNKDMY